MNHFSQRLRERAEAYRLRSASEARAGSLDDAKWLSRFAVMFSEIAADFDASATTPLADTSSPSFTIIYPPKVWGANARDHFREESISGAIDAAGNVISDADPGL